MAFVRGPSTARMHSPHACYLRATQEPSASNSLLITCRNMSAGNHISVISLFTSSALLVLIECSSAGTLDSCKVHTDCLHSEAAARVGRCAPLEVYCNQGLCGAMCAKIC